MQVRPKAKQWKPFEIELHAQRPHANPYLDVEVWAEVIGPDGEDWALLLEAIPSR